MEQKMKASQICQALRKRFKQPEWSLFFEVASGTGANCKRHADAVAMNMYPSRGLTILGFEIKVSHNDLMQEIHNPDKAEEIAQYCDEWWLVVPAKLVSADELIPKNWGILEYWNDVLRIRKRAEKLKPQQLAKPFVASLLRSAGKLDENTLQIVKTEAYNEYAKNWESALSAAVDRETERLKETLKNYEAFERLTGEKINLYTDVEDFAERWNMAKNIQKIYGKYGELQSLLYQMERFVDNTKKLVGDNMTESGSVR